MFAGDHSFTLDIQMLWLEALGKLDGDVVDSIVQLLTLKEEICCCTDAVQPH